MGRTVMILGTEYRIEIHKWSEDSELSKNSWAGYCCCDLPLIVIADLDDEEHVPRMGHEETMVDWIANQFPKIADVYEKLGIL